MSLQAIADHSRTDKGTRHPYLEVYDKLFAYQKEKAKKVLEVGIARGGSIHLWRRWFDQAHITGVDCASEFPNDLLTSRITLHTKTNAYSQECINKLEPPYDVLIDDGSHALEDIKTFLRLYLPLLTEDGILVVEDILKPEWVDELIPVVPEELRKYIKTFDLRHKGVYDSFLFVVDKSFVLSS